MKGMPESETVRISAEGNRVSPSPSVALSREALLDALKMILTGTSLVDVLTSITRLIEAHSDGMLCSIFLVQPDGVHMRCVRRRRSPITRSVVSSTNVNEPAIL